jgi:AcrR family transcriptional regulator
MSTRETIIREALNLFYVKGYDAVSLRDIASRVGIKESSLYNHFKNKQDLFDSIVEWCATRNSEHFHDARLVGDDLAFRADAGTVGLYGAMSEDQFVETSGQVFEAVFADEIEVKLRRMLTIEQYRGEKQARLFREISFGQPEVSGAAVPRDDGRGLLRSGGPGDAGASVLRAGVSDLL